MQIEFIGVHPSYRRIGLGGKVLCALLKKAKDLGVHKALLEVKSTNTAAKSLYSANGFNLIGLRKKYYKDNSDALIFRCELINETAP